MDHHPCLPFDIFLLPLTAHNHHGCRTCVSGDAAVDSPSLWHACCQRCYRFGVTARQVWEMEHSVMVRRQLHHRRSAGPPSPVADTGSASGSGPGSEAGSANTHPAQQTQHDSHHPRLSSMGAGDGLLSVNTGGGGAGGGVEAAQEERCGGEEVDWRFICQSLHR